MSGFEFHLTCSQCGLASQTYPFLYDRVVAPTTLELPVADRARATFERVSIAITDKLSQTEIAALAAARSTVDVTVLVPHFGNSEVDVIVVPATACPQCGGDAIVGRFGHRPRLTHPIDSLDEAIEASRSCASEHTLSFRLLSPALTVRCMRSDEGARTWYVDRARGIDVAPVVDELRAKLVMRGSSCDEPVSLHGFVRFLERIRSASADST